METSNGLILPPTIKWVEVRNQKTDTLEGLGAEFHLGFRKRRIGWQFDKNPTNAQLHHARDEIEKSVKKEWQRWLVRTTVI